MNHHLIRNDDPTEVAFLKAVLADPEDDTVRLAYADWLDECGRISVKACLGQEEYPTHDAERADLIRTQIEIANRPDGVNCGDLYCTSRDLCSSCSEFRALCRRRDKLLRLIDPSWWVPTYQPHIWAVKPHRPDRKESPCVVVDKGFAIELVLRPGTWLRVYKEMLAAHPIRRVVFTERAVVSPWGGYGGLWRFRWPDADLDDVTMYDADLAKYRAPNGNFLFGVNDGSPIHLLLASEWPSIEFLEDYR